MPLTFSVATTTRRAQVYIALAGVVALEILFGAMHRLSDWKLHAIEFIVLGLAAGAAYLVALYALEHAGEPRAARAVAFHRLAPLPLGRPHPGGGMESLCGASRRPAPDRAARCALGRNACAGYAHDLSARRRTGVSSGVAAYVETSLRRGRFQGAHDSRRHLHPGDAGLVVSEDRGEKFPACRVRLESPGGRGICRQRPQRRARPRVRSRCAAHYTAVSGGVNGAADSGGADESVSRGAPAAVAAQSRLAAHARELEMRAGRWRDHGDLPGAVLAGLGRAGRECGEFRAEPKELSRELVHRGGLACRRSGHSRGAGSRRGLRTCAVVGGAARRVHARGVCALRSDPASFAEWLFLVLHVDGAAAVLFSKSGVAAADRAAVSFLQGLD